MKFLSGRGAEDPKPKEERICAHKHKRKIESWSGAFMVRYVWCDDCDKSIKDDFKGKPDKVYMCGN